MADPAATRSVRDAARSYFHQGFMPLPVKFRGKTPTAGKRWQEFAIAEANLPQHFNGQTQNIGLLLGKPSGGLVDIDLDVPEAADLATRFLPRTEAIFGRKGKPHSHCLYVADPIPKTAQFRDPDGTMLCELRSTGGQTVVPPSVHTSGELIEWESNGEPTRIDADQLLITVSRLAAAVLLARHWPNKGSRQDAAIALAGGLARSDGFPNDQIEDFVEVVSFAANDEETETRRQGAAITVQKIVDGNSEVTGWPKLAEIIGDEVVKRVRKWLGIELGGAGRTHVWPDPQPLPELPDVMPFDNSILPSSLRPWIADIAERMQCPPDYPAVAAMIVLAALSGRRVGVRPKKHDDWTVVPNLWGVAIGPPSIMKTPAIREPLNILKRLEIEAKTEHDKALKDYQAASLVADQKKKVKQQEIKKELSQGGDGMEIARALQDEVPESPVRKRFLVNDSTVEKLGEILNENPNGIAIFRDELIGFLKSLDKEGHEAARAFYLESWDGKGRFTYDRIGRGTIDIDAAIVSIIGGIQPGPLSQYLQAAIRGGVGDDGLVQRFQLAVWPDISKEWRNVDRWPDTQAKQRAFEMYLHIANLDPASIGSEHDPKEPDSIPFLRFTAQAQIMFNDWREDLELRLRSGEDHAAIESHLGKYRSLIPSLALLIHLAEDGNGPVSAAALQKAILWERYLESHARRIYSVCTCPAIDAAKALAKKILTGAIEDGFALRDVYRRGWTNLTTREQAAAAVDVLEDLDWLNHDVQPTGGRTRTRFFVNPKIIESVLLATDKTDESPPSTTSVGSVSASPGESEKNPANEWGDI